MNLLSNNVLGLLFKNPLLPASGTFNMGREVADFFPLDTFGGLVTKGLTKEKRLGNPTPRTFETAGGMLNSVGLQNPGVDSFLKNDLEFLKKWDVPVIANASGSTVADYCYVVGALDESSVDAVELNISCPNVAAGGMAFGVDENLTFEVVSAARKLTKKPLIVKLSPNVTDIKKIAKAAERAGADAISLINTVAAMAVDIETRRPVLGNRIGGLSGACVKPIALKMVWDVYNTVKIPVIGCGGVRDYRDVIEFMLVGASLVQVGTTLLTDPMNIPNITRDLEKWFREKGIKSITEIIGGLIV